MKPTFLPRFEFFIMVQMAGIEPASRYRHQLLRLTRLPVSPHLHIFWSASRLDCHTLSDFCAVFSGRFHSLLGKPIIANIIRALPDLWSWWTDLNPRPDAYKASALPTELHQHLSIGFFAPPQISTPCPYRLSLLPHGITDPKHFCSMPVMS